MSKADDVITYAQQELGKPYVFGDEGPSTFDCSGLMQFIFGKVGVALPRTAEEQQRFATPTASPAPGDLVFWGQPAYHVALYIGAGKIIAAPNAGATVEVEDLAGQPPTGYGRIPGVGSALAPVLGVATSAVSTVANLPNLLGGARHVVLETTFVIAGAGLLGYGLYRTIRPARGGAQ